LPPHLFTHQFQAKPIRCFLRVASIIERIDLGFTSNSMRVRVSLTAPKRIKKLHYFKQYITPKISDVT